MPRRGVEVVTDDAIAVWLERHEQAVLGATAYSCLKADEELSGFDLVVIDEASQVRVPEAAVAASLVGDTGRLVLAGDHLQLPPIIAGTYPETPAGRAGAAPFHLRGGLSAAGHRCEAASGGE